MNRTKLHHILLFLLSVSLCSVAVAAAVKDSQPLVEALRWIRAPLSSSVQYDYVMTVRVRFVIFWAGKDDVGGGYIRRGISSNDAHQEFIQVLFGSDPVKATRAINRWGAGTEVDWHKEPVSIPAHEGDVTASAFFGFMKSSRGKSVVEMQKELKKEGEQGQHSFNGILSRVDPDQALSTIVPLQSDTDYNLHQYDVAEPIMLDRMAASELPVRSFSGEGRCSRAGSFLATVAELLEASLDGRPAPLSRCYVHNAQENTLTLESATPVAALPVKVHGTDGSNVLDTTYTNLLQLEFVSTHKENGKKAYFTIFTTAAGPLRGVPVQIRYQPNWWFQIVLNLRPESAAKLSSTPPVR